MATAIERTGDVVVVRLSATVDGRAAVEFERAVSQQFEAGARLFVIDFTGVSLITSAGIRVLLLLRKWVAAEGGLALCALSDRVQTLLDVAGLRQQFHVAATRDEAVAFLTTRRPSAPAAEPRSPLAMLILRLMGQTLDQADGTGSREERPAAVPALATRVADLLDRRKTPTEAPPADRSGTSHGPCPD